MEPTDFALRLAARTAEYRQRQAQRRLELESELLALLVPSFPFTWEIGCGHGHFLAAYAQAHPDQLCIGIDIMGERIERALRKRDRARLKNLHFLHADARLFLEVIPPGVAFSRLFLLFPDPWPKLRHHKHRVLNHEFLAAASRRSTPDASLFFRTDFEPYFDEARAIVARHPAWEEALDAWPFEFSTVFQARAVQHRSLIARRRPALPVTIS
ncbi:MAG: tRNA (guanosine(46)-N7)-methyltransferase TrmB [Opitutaceae bacterium]|nr:tRNA (guanosine(46)-N7)-methyltransferase TrmB [Opitutaceae bacterium]